MDAINWETISYIVTVIGFPFALVVFMLEQHKERQNEEAQIYQKLSDDYTAFSKLLLENADLRLMSEELPDEVFSEEQKERKKVIFDILISLFERAYILVHQKNMNQRTRRLWRTWADFIESWCERQDFKTALPELLQGEDPEFGQYQSSSKAYEFSLALHLKIAAALVSFHHLFVLLRHSSLVKFLRIYNHFTQLRSCLCSIVQ